MPSSPGHPPPPQSPAPLWAWLLLGWLVGRGWAESIDVRSPASSAIGGMASPLVCTLETEPLPPGIPGLGDFRAVPGIGRARALKLIEHLWQSGGGTDFGQNGVAWEEIDGIGPVISQDLTRAFGGTEGSEAGEGCRVPTGDGVHSGRTPGHDNDSLGTCGSGKRAVLSGP